MDGGLAHDFFLLNLKPYRSIPQKSRLIHDFYDGFSVVIVDEA